MVWKKGETGNPHGRPKLELTLNGPLRKLLNQRGPDGRKNAVAVAFALIEAALAGNVMAIREIFDRVDGKVLQPTLVLDEARVEREIERAKEVFGLSDEEAAKLKKLALAEAENLLRK